MLRFDDPAVLGMAGVIVAGFAAMIGAIVSKRVSSTAEDQQALNTSFQSYMTSTDKTIERIEAEHQECESRVVNLRGIIVKLVKAMRERGIPLPLFTQSEQTLMLEHKSFEGNGETRYRVPPSE